MNITPIEYAYFKRIRKENDDISALASKIKVSRGLLYDIESGRRTLSSEVFENVINYYEIKYDGSRELYDEGYNLVLELFKHTVKIDKSGFFKLYEQFEEKIDVYKHSKAFIFVDLIKSMRETKLKNYKSGEVYLEKCKEYIDQYDNNIIFIYAIQWMFTKEIEDNVKELRKILIGTYNKYSLNNLDSYILGMLYYQIGRLLQIEEDYFEADKYFDESIKYFKFNGLLNREIQANIQKAISYMEIKQFEKAEKIYLEMYNKALENNFIGRIKACCDNLTVLYFVINKFDKAEKFYQSAKKNGSTFSDINFYHAYIVYKTKPLKEARSEISRLIKNEKKKRILLSLKFIQAMLNQNDSKVDEYYESALEEFKLINAKIDDKLLTKMIIEYYQNRNNDKFNKLVKEYFEKYY